MWRTYPHAMQTVQMVCWCAGLHGMHLSDPAWFELRRYTDAYTGFNSHANCISESVFHCFEGAFHPGMRGLCWGCRWTTSHSLQYDMLRYPSLCVTSRALSFTTVPHALKSVYTPIPHRFNSQYSWLRDTNRWHSGVERMSGGCTRV